MATWQLRLYVCGAAPRSTRAIETVKALCEEHIKGDYKLEVIDLYQQPERAKTAQIVATPTLVRELPEPVRYLIGDLSNHDRLLVSLDLKPRRG